MREVLLTSSALILALLVLRRVFREKIARRVQYALWALALVRLLVPVSLPALDFSVLTLAEPVRETISARLETPSFTAPAASIPASAQRPQDGFPEAEKPASPQGAAPEKEAETGRRLTMTEVLGMVWLAGAAGMGLLLAWSNLRFARRLRRRRMGIEAPGCRYPVYMVESGLDSPCLFGLLRPAIYLTPAAIRSEESLRHVLAHEETHGRHLDPLWSLLRGVCLAVYWFDPLVWLAASASRTDCELACDEGAVRALGEEERLAYGRTLLSLIPVRRRPGNPLLSATTMSSDKKRLRDRIARIAENRTTRKPALCAMALLTAAACVFTFAGCAESDGKKGPDGPPAAEGGPLTGAELRYFNESFFNGEYMNIRNQFLSSVYERPEDIDIFELAYCGVPAEYIRDSGKPQADQAVILDAVYGGEAPDCPQYECSTATLDAFLTDTMGLTLAETNKVGVGNFVYLPEYDAYYWAHGDTNYRGQVDLSAGVREGELVRLYYDDTFYADGWKCVTLRELESGGYQFVSNVYCEKPVIPTVYPAEEPLAVIPLADLEGSEPEEIKMKHHSGDCEERLLGPGQNWRVGDHHVQGYRSTDGIIYLAEVTEAAAGSDGMSVWEADCFMVMPNDEFHIELCSDLFGRDGFLTYAADYEISNYSFLWYQAFDDDGTLLNLVSYQAAGEIDAQVIDLNGDGVNELLCTSGDGDARLFFQRDGRIVEADIAALLGEALPEESGFLFTGIDPYSRCLTVQTSLSVQAESGGRYGAAPTRDIYFDGEKLLVWRTAGTEAA